MASHNGENVNNKSRRLGAPWDQRSNQPGLSTDTSRIVPVNLTDKPRYNPKRPLQLIPLWRVLTPPETLTAKPQNVATPVSATLRPGFGAASRH